MYDNKIINIGSLIRHTLPLFVGQSSFIRVGIIIEQNKYGFKIAWQDSINYPLKNTFTWIAHNIIHFDEYAVIT